MTGIMHEQASHLVPLDTSLMLPASAAGATLDYCAWLPESSHVGCVNVEGVCYKNKPRWGSDPKVQCKKAVLLHKHAA